MLPIAEGLVDPVTDGELECWEEGDPEAATTGELVGWDEGSPDAAATGEAEGCDDGDWVGNVVGLSVLLVVGADGGLLKSLVSVKRTESSKFLDMGRT